jgi:hypothetical protein
MALIQRPAKQGGSTEYQGKVAQGYTKILSAEMDADLDTIYAAWNGGADTVNLVDNAVTSAKIAPGAVGSRELSPSVYLWQVAGTGTALTPVDATKDITIGRAYLSTQTANTDVIRYGASAAKFHIGESASNNFQLFMNAAFTGAIDNTARPAWALGAGPATDTLVVYRSPAGTTASWTTLFTLDNAGRVTVPGPAAAGADQSSLILGTRTGKGRVAALPGIDWFGVSYNQFYNGSAWAQDDVSKPSALLEMDASGISFQRAPAGAIGSLGVLFAVDTVGHLTAKAMACSINNNSVLQGLNATTWTTVVLTTLGYDSSSGVMPVTAASQIKTPAGGGWVLLSAYCTFQTAPNSFLILQASADGSTGWATVTQTSATASSAISLAMLTYSTSPLYYRVQVYSSAAANVAYAVLNAVNIAGL